MWISKHGNTKLAGNISPSGQVSFEDDDINIMGNSAHKAWSIVPEVANYHHEFHTFDCGSREDESNPEVLEIGPDGTMLLSYPLNPDTLKKIRDYQHHLRSTAPSWTSMIEVMAAENRIMLKVFPISSAPSVLFSRPHVYR